MILADTITTTASRQGRLASVFRQVMRQACRYDIL